MITKGITTASRITHTVEAARLQIMVLQCLEVHLEVPSLLTFLPALMTAVCQISNTCTHIHIFEYQNSRFFGFNDSSSGGLGKGVGRRTPTAESCQGSCYATITDSGREVYGTLNPEPTFRWLRGFVYA